jgi:hypothetical protein
MAKRRKKSRKTAASSALRVVAEPATGFVEAAERAVISQSTKFLSAANRQYTKLVRQARDATTDRSKRKYIAAALSAVAIAGVLANDLRKRLDARPAGGRKKRL